MIRLRRMPIALSRDVVRLKGGYTYALYRKALKKSSRLKK